MTPELGPVVWWWYCPVPISGSSLHCCNDAVNLGQNKDEKRMPSLSVCSLTVFNFKKRTVPSLN